MTERLEDRHVSVPTTEVLHSMMEKLNKKEWTDHTNPPTIFMVPNTLRQGNDDAYEPKLISIGPLHRDKPELKQMESVKWMYLHDLVNRAPNSNSLKKYIDILSKEEVKARRLYPAHLPMSTKEFVEMLVLDGCFIIEFLTKRANNEMGNPWSIAKWSLPVLRNDLLLLENQIPFFILKILYDNSHIQFTKGDRPTFSELACQYLKLSLHSGNHEIHHLLHLNYLSKISNIKIPTTSNGDAKACKWTLRSAPKAIYELLVVFLYFFGSWVLMCKRPRHQSAKKRMNDKAPRALPSAKNLREAGIKFKRKKGEECFLNVSFNEQEGILEIPFLSLQQNTTSGFRNLIALEQCCPGVANTHITAYATFMDKIIDTSEDVGILVKSGIIESKLGTDEDVAGLINNICKGASLDYESHYLAAVFKEVNGYYNSDRHRWRAELVNRYFHNPWAVVSFILAIILLLLTIGGTTASIYQTVYTVKTYKKQFDGPSPPRP